MQLPREARLVGSVTGVVDDHELGAGPRAAELPRVGDGRHEIEASLHEDAGDVRKQVGVAEQDPVLEEDVVPDVVRHEARERQGEVGVAVARVQRHRRRPIGCGGLPRAPRECGTSSHLGIGVVQESRVRLHDVPVACVRRHPVEKCPPLHGEQRRHAAAEPPVSLHAPSRGDAPQDHLRDPVRVRLGVGERQRAAPRSAPHQPPVDVEVRAQQLHVRDEVLRGVGPEIDVRLARVRRAPTAVALIEQHDAIGGRIEQPAVPRRAAGSGATVDHDGRLASRVAACLPIDAIAVSDVQHPVRVWLGLLVQARHRSSPPPSSTPTSSAATGEHHDDICVHPVPLSSG